MRRVMAGVAVLLSGLVLAGCSAPAGLDGDLVDDWKPVTEPVAFVPPTGVCYPDDFAETAYLTSFNPVDCGSSHRVETAHVGSFTGAVAERTAPPEQGSGDIKPAFAECDAKATAYVGDNWRSGRLFLGVATPSPAAWGSGARWFRCDLAEVDDEDDGSPVTRSGSLKGALAGASRLRLGCFGVKLDNKGELFDVTPAECTAKHNSEYVGVWPAPELPFPKRDRDYEPLYAGCRSVVAKYVGVPDDRNLQFRTGVLTLPPTEEQWQMGNRGVRCYLWLRNRDLTKSLKGTGQSGLPIQYR
ncbi:septum formation family protein [Plantactinospora sp. GCM10030261]|uniref:septum formation family protein n=1 Tax=Plantactinospora sp. GCM10030261 TaxID=3273420 RepID=UPI00360E966A